MRFLIHNFERRPGGAALVPGRAHVLPCTDWIDVECVESGASWIALPGKGRGAYECVDACGALHVTCRRCDQSAKVPVPR